MKKTAVYISVLLFITNWIFSQDLYPVRQLTYNMDRCGFPHWSPDGSLMVYAAMVEGVMELHIMSVENGNSIPLAVTAKDHNEGPVWSPDGSQLAFASTRGGSHNIWLMDIDIKRLREDLKMPPLSGDK